MENFGTFVRRHRFKIRDLFPSPANGAPRQHFELAKNFSDRQYLQWSIGGKGVVELNQAFKLVEYMSECSTDHQDGFSRYVSFLSDDAWAFAIQFTPYCKVNTALENLGVVRSALFEAVLTLNAAKAGMESSWGFSDSRVDVYSREQSKATSSLLNFSALYASYIDVCRRVRKYAGQVNDRAYQRAIRRLMGKNLGAHGFVKGFRNFILHHHLLQPYVQISYGDARAVELLLNSNSLLYSGFEWTVDARSYIQRGADLDVLETVNVVSKDVDRLIKFHKRMVETRLRREKFAFDTYIYERSRFKHLQSSVTDMSMAFIKRPTPMISRLLSSDLLEQVLNSLLPDDDVRFVLCALADRHKNLSSDVRKIVTREIGDLLGARIRFENTGAYLQGRKFE